MADADTGALRVIAESPAPNLSDPTVRAQRRREAEALIRTEAERRRQRRAAARTA